MVELYNFKDQVSKKTKRNNKTLLEFLTERDYEIKLKSSSVKIIKTDLITEEKAGKIRFGKDGVYLTSEGIEYRGYMHLKTYKIELYNRFPNFHITRCSTVIEIENRKDFVWHNSNVTEVQDRSSKNLYTRNLILCGNCRIETKAKIQSTQDFFDELENSQITETNKRQVDLNGYTLEWQDISKNFREKKNYTCECCNIELSDDKRYIESHHKNGNKTDNSFNNLECLCVLCHSYKDERHVQNSTKRSSRMKLDLFVKKYSDELIECGNKYLSLYSKI